MNLQNLVRENIRRLTPYSSARREFAGRAEIFLDANENSGGSPLAKNYHRYPDPRQRALKEKIAVLQNVRPDEIFIGNGSDEAIDLLFRIFCRPQKDNVVICPPTYGMYEISAAINDVEVRRAGLTADFRLDRPAIDAMIDAETKLLFICSPNNPTGNAFAKPEIIELAKNFGGILVVDEAYIHFSREDSMLREIEALPNLVVLQTFSKAWGLAGLRVGAAFANRDIIALFNRVKPPYNLSQLAQETVLDALENRAAVEKMIVEIIAEREKLIKNLARFSFVEKIHPSDANFVLVKTRAAGELYDFMLEERIVVRNRSAVEFCENCLRITIGTREENEILISSLEKYEKSFIY